MRRNLYLRHAVILVVEHTVKGSWGIQINFPHTSASNLGSIIQNQGLWSDLEQPVYFGGQHHVQRCFILHSNDWSSETTLSITDDISLSGDMYILSAISAGQGPKYIRPVIGLHQWGAGELDTEIQQSADSGWLVCNPSIRLIFDYEGDTQWQKVLAQATKSIVDQIWN